MPKSAPWVWCHAQDGSGNDFRTRQDSLSPLPLPPRKPTIIRHATGSESKFDECRKRFFRVRWLSETSQQFPSGLRRDSARHYRVLPIIRCNGHTFATSPKTADSRRAIATTAHDLEKDPMAAKGLLRHSSVLTTQKHNIKEVPETTLNAMKKVEALCNDRTKNPHARPS